MACLGQPCSQRVTAGTAIRAGGLIADGPISTPEVGPLTKVREARLNDYSACCQLSCVIGCAVQGAGNAAELVMFR
jgi:hypothetical protein